MSRLRAEEGFGLVELLIAMTVMSIGLMALLASYSAGYVTLQRASRQGTASALADRTLEALRGQAYTAVAPGTSSTTYSSATTPPSPDGRTYTVTTAITAGTAVNTAASAVKVVTVTVVDASGRTWASQRSLLDPLTG